MTPQEYAQQIRSLNLQSMKIRDSSLEDAINDTQVNLRYLEQAQTELYRLKRSVKADINAEWESYHAHAKALETGNTISDFLLPLIFGRRSHRSRSLRRYKKENLHIKREENLEVYRKIEGELNHLLDAVVLAKKQLESSLISLRAKLNPNQVKCRSCNQVFMPRSQGHTLCYDCYKREKATPSSTTTAQIFQQASRVEQNEQKCIQCGKTFVARASYHRLCYSCYTQNRQS